MEDTPSDSGKGVGDGYWLGVGGLIFRTDAQELEIYSSVGTVHRFDKCYCEHRVILIEGSPFFER